MTSLRQLQIEELNILKRVVKVCEENNIRYYLLGGTLLGAVRHKGFIPWDDDIDIALPRADYEKLIKIYGKDKTIEGDYLDHFSTNPNFRYAFARISNDVIKVINRSANKERKEPISIDIIPFESLPDNKIVLFFYKLRLSFWWSINNMIQFDELVDQKRKRGFVGTILVKAASIVASLFKNMDYHICFNKMEKILKKYPYDMDTEKIINFYAAYGFDEIFPRSSFSESKMYEFEDSMFCGPIDYDSVLKAIYGDGYMTPPPENERNKHNTEIQEQ